MKFSMIFVFVLLGLANVVFGQAPTLALLAQWMEGSFSSQEQRLQDDRFMDVNLHIRVVSSDEESVLMYVEQSLFSQPDKPYRQRFYKLSKRGNVFVSETLEMEKPHRFVGAWKTPQILRGFPKDSLISKPGCSVFLVWNSIGYFEGKTEARRCESKINGASFATSEVKIYPNRLESWDRGYSLTGNQVWGSKFGAYIFNKMGEIVE